MVEHGTPLALEARLRGKLGAAGNDTADDGRQLQRTTAGH